MITTNRTQEEKNINRIILLGSTFVIFVVAVIIAYLFIGAEVNEFKKHLKTFESTLIQREKHSTKTLIDNLVNDITEEKRNEYAEIRKRVRSQTLIVHDLIQSIMAQNTLKKKDEIMLIVMKTIRAITTGSDLDFYIFDYNGTLIFNSRKGVGEGINFIDFKDINGERFVKKIVQKNAFVEYAWFVPKKSKISRKITYSIKMNKLGIVIGFGEFLDNQYSIKKSLYWKISRKKLNDNTFVFAYEIMALNNISQDSKLLVNKNIITTAKELKVMEEILIKSDYMGGQYFEYGDKIVYAVFLLRYRIFIASGIDLKAINAILDAEQKRSRENLEKNILSLAFNILIVAFVFFIFSYLVSKKIERMFRNYRIKIARSQQLLIQKSKMATMGEMIGNIEHQWRQPLSQISGLFHDIESAYDYKELDKKYLASRVDEANDLLEYMSETMEEFKDFFNPNTILDKFTVYEGVEKALKIIGASLKSSNIAIEFDINKKISIEGYLNEFSQVILNILSNSKEISIQRRTENPTIGIDCIEYDTYIHVQISDNCGGVDEQIIDRIFEPYVTSKYSYGTGIGLYMSRMIIENKMYGKIFVANTKDGVLFTIELPIHQQ